VAALFRLVITSQPGPGEMKQIEFQSMSIDEAAVPRQLWLSKTGSKQRPWYFLLLYAPRLQMGGGRQPVR